MSEQSGAMWGAVESLFLGLDPIRVENSVYPGTPDVNYVNGWVELKYAEEWPVHEDTDLKIKHFTAQQRVWLFRRWCHGGAAHLLLQVAHDWFLFEGHKASECVGVSPKAVLMAKCLVCWKGCPRDREEFQAWLKRS